MINPSSLEYFIEKLRALNDVHSIDQAQDLESAQEICSASKSPKILVFQYKSTIEPPKDWLSSVQYCDQEFGVLITEKQTNRPRQGHQSDTLQNRIITALMGGIIDDDSTPIRLKSAESLSADLPQSLVLLVFSNRTLVGNP